MEEVELGPVGGGGSSGPPFLSLHPWAVGRLCQLVLLSSLSLKLGVQMPTLQLAPC